MEQTSKVYVVHPLPKILSIARAGSPARAWDLFVSEGWGEKVDDPKVLTLKGRLLKDQAKASQSEDRARLFGEAAAAYEAAAALENDSYPLINAASLALLGGKPKRAADLARQVLDMLDGDPEQGENAYWRRATRSEALLLLGERSDARAALSDAMLHFPSAWEDHAATIGQFATIVEEQNGDYGPTAKAEDLAWLDRYRPPTSLHFSGIIGLDEDDPNIRRSIDKTIDQMRPGFVYGALAAGSDILIAQAFCANETLQDMGAELHVVLPYPADQFCELSVRPFGAHWVAQYEELLGKAATVNILGLDNPPLKPAIALSDQVAMGQALRNAQVLHSHAKVLTIIGAGEQPRPRLQDWKKAGRELIILETPRKNNNVHSQSRQEDSKAQDIRSFLWVEGSPEGASRGEHGQVFDHLEDAYAEARSQMTLAGSSVRASIVCDIMDADSPALSVRMFAKELAAAAPAGSIATNQTGAMLATMLDNVQSCEEMGELKTAAGRVPLWVLK